MTTEQHRGIPSLTYEIGVGGQYDPGLYNADLAPVPANERSWTWVHFAALWVGMAVCIPTYTLASSLVAGGWSWQAAVGSVVLGNFIVLIPIALVAEAGTRYGIPFPVFARASFGVVGANIPALLRAVVACGWFGIQTWIGGFAIFKLLEALWPGIATLPTILPGWVGLGTGELICFTLFWLVQVWIVLRGMDSIKFLETYGSPFLLVIGLALLAWAYVKSGGWGPLLANPAPSTDRTGPALGILGAGLTSAVAFWGTMALSIPDFSRYARSQRDQAVGQAVGLPVTMALFAFIGAAVTNATVVIFATRISDPIELLARVGGPAMVIVSMLGLTVATLTTNIAANVVSPANAFSNVSPSRISFRKGAMITAVIGVLMFPWKLYSDAAAYIFTWLIGYGALLGPVAGIMIADYFLIRRRVLRPDALFLRGRQYEYTGGVNLVAVVALVAGILPNLPGFLGALGAVEAPGWATAVYQWAWFVGFVISAVVHLIGMSIFYPRHRVIGPPALADTLVFSSHTGQALSTKTGEERIPVTSDLLLVTSNRLTPEDLDRNFADIAPPLTADAALVESSKCLFCYDAPCTIACPTHIDVPAFIKKIMTGNLTGSARVILDANPMGHSCARACPVEVLCEGACVLNHRDEEPIKIALLQRYATDHVLAHDLRLFSPGVDNGRRVAIVGAGPAGLSCAQDLRRWGYAVTMFDAHSDPGGLNTYAIAEYKMRPPTALAEAKKILELGVELHTNVTIGRDIPFSDLERDFDAVFVGVGVGATRELGIPGEDLAGVRDALSFIEQLKTHPYADTPVGDDVIVVGAGNTAIDAATQARRLGAKRVTVVYRRGEDEMPAYAYEYELAKRDGCEFRFLTIPKRVLGTGAVAGLECARAELGSSDARGRRAPVEIPGSEHVIPCDMLLKATGQLPRAEFARDAGLAIEGGRMTSSKPHVFIGGDAASGGAEIVNAAAEGKSAAARIHALLSTVAKVA